MSKERNSREPMSTPRASSLSYNLDLNPNKNGQVSHWQLFPYDNNGWKCELNETNTSIIKKISKSQGPIFHIYPILKINNSLSKCTHYKNNNTSFLYILCILIPQIIPLLHPYISLYVVWRVHHPKERVQSY